MKAAALDNLLSRSTELWPDRLAVADAFGRVTYAELSSLSRRFRAMLASLSIGNGDRVGICLRKSIDSVAVIFGVLEAGAAYVPVGPDVPAVRNAFVFSDCSVKAIITEQEFEAQLRAEFASIGFAATLLVLDRSGGGEGLSRLLDQHKYGPAAEFARTEASPDKLAYVLYTSGSTGKPKGVMLSHRNGLTFIQWCAEVLQPTEVDVFSSHAPFHFDLSILDIYVPLMHGALLVLIGEEVGKDPLKLAALIDESRISVWYSTPSVLTMLTEYGQVENRDFSAMRMILFAGEVFPIKHLRKLANLLPRRRYLNLYGPTETNVCTYHELPSEIPAEQTSPFPIGRTCSHLQSRVVDVNGSDVSRGESGELCIAGPGVMQGYWNRPEQTQAVFLVDERGQPWYRTGDLVTEEDGGIYSFQGRKDRMIKRRGFRVELGEIEAALYRHPQVKEAAVIAQNDGETGITVKAFIGYDQQRPSIIALKQFCANALPVYMVPDVFAFLEALPKTSTDKIDYESLKRLV